MTRLWARGFSGLTRLLAVRGVVGGFAASMDINGEQFRRDGEQVTLQVTLDPNNEKCFILKSGPMGPRLFYEKPAILRRLTATPPSRGRGLWHFGVQHWRHNCNFRNVGSFLRKELGGALRIGPKNEKYFLLKSGPSGASAFLRKACYPPSPNGATPFQRKGAMAVRRTALETQL